LGSYIAFAIFAIPPAVARNVETIMLGRFFGGVFASGPLAIVGGVCGVEFRKGSSAEIVSRLWLISGLLHLIKSVRLHG